LRAFREVARHRGVSAAAEQIHLSQPAVTQAIAKLEGLLGVSLFERRADGMYTTEPGTMFLQRVERMLDHLAEGADMAHKLANRKKPSGFQDFHLLVTAAQLRALSAIANAGNFSIAARSINISQPTIYRAGRDLERLSGMHFFDATSQGVALTPPAEIFARHVNLAASELRQGLFEIEDFKGKDSTKIFVGSMPLARTSVLPAAIHATLREKDQIQIRTIDGPYSELLRGLRNGEIDFLIGAIRDPAPADDVVQEKLFDDPLRIIVGKNHPLATRRSVELSDTLDFPWIAPPQNTPTGSYLYDIDRKSVV